MSLYSNDPPPTSNLLSYSVILLITFLLFKMFGSKSAQSSPTTIEEEPEEPDPPRNFTSSQLRLFDGTSASVPTAAGSQEEQKPVYLSVHGTVFDVSNGRNFYGPGGPYEVFAGRECGAALAKMSFDDEFLDQIDLCESLNFGEREQLNEWISKFRDYKCYPVLGRLVPDSKIAQTGTTNNVLDKEFVKEQTGEGEVPEGYATSPIYVGCGDNYYDVSFGGVGFYAKGCSYHRFAGKDASRALAMMSFEPADIDSTNLSDLDDTKTTTLRDWCKTFKTKKSYPIVGQTGQKFGH